MPQTDVAYRNRRTLLRLLFVVLVFPGSVCAAEPEKEPQGKVGDYDQWRQALDSGAATDASTLTALPGFKVELLRSAAMDEDSWISLAIDSRGRLTIGREDKGLLRIALPSNADASIRTETINDTLEECRGLLYVGDRLYVNANDSKGFYCLRDTDGDDRFDEVKLLKKTGGDVGHGRNDLVLGPDGRIYLAHGNDTRLPDDFVAGSSAFAHYGVDRLLPCSWNAQLFNAGVVPPAGHIIRTDLEGKTWEMVAGGFRNPFGIDFNADGEMFTFDADMEWDVGAPWYRPCRVNHIVSGGDYGWRQGTGKWPAYYPDSLHSTLDIGLASPTAVKFGTRSNFPPRYGRALFILDWAYGRIIAVHLTPQGASYAARAETFVKGRPLNVTDLDFGPDGTMYFVTGGRRTQSGLYRVTYTGPAVEAVPPTPDELERDRQAATARALRRRLEAFHGRHDPQAIDVAWPHLDSRDPWIRHAARVAIEHQPSSKWHVRALAESRPTAALTALLALARVGESSLRDPIWGKLNGTELEQLSPELKLIALRTYILSFIRMGKPDQQSGLEIAARLDRLYPDASPAVNQELCELLVYLESPHLIGKTLPLVATAKTQEEKLHYLFVLRNLERGWTRAERIAYFRWIRQAEHFVGARYMPTFISHIKSDALATLTAEDRAVVDPIFEAEDSKVKQEQLASSDRPVVRKWTMDDLAGSLESVGNGRNYEQGKAMFAAAMCNRCHQFAGQGGTIGPDLTAVASRFSRRDLLESIITPSKVVDEKYRDVMIATTSGSVVVGSIVGGDDRNVVVATNPLVPDQVIRIPKEDIELKQFSLVSPMPLGALDTLSKDEILDLLAYIEAAGDPKRLNFQP